MRELIIHTIIRCLQYMNLVTDNVILRKLLQVKFQKLAVQADRRFVLGRLKVYNSAVKLEKHVAKIHVVVQMNFVPIHQKESVVQWRHPIYAERSAVRTDVMKQEMGVVIRRYVVKNVVMRVILQETGVVIRRYVVKNVVMRVILPVMIAVMVSFVALPAVMKMDVMKQETVAQHVQ